MEFKYSDYIKYAQISSDGKTIYLFDDFTKRKPYLTIIERGFYRIENGVLTLTGSRLIEGIAMFETFIDESDDNKPRTEYIKYRFDIFSFKKKPYVKGWFFYEKSELYKLVTNQWSIIID